jgi:hypothetical protein
MPKAFASTIPNESSVLESWIVCLSYDNSPLDRFDSSKVVAISEQAMSENGHLYVFLPIAYKLSKSPDATISELSSALASNVDIASLINSYTSLLEKDSQQSSAIANNDFENERI